MTKADFTDITHEELVVLDDPESGLKGYIAIHSTKLGPAAGGCRVMQYESNQEALRDAMRLSQGMTYKNALAQLPLGGGKAVINLPKTSHDRTKIFAAFGRAVERLDGRYITAEDVGTSVQDMGVVASETDYVAGLPLKSEQAGGDPSPWTALGVFLSIEVAARMQLNRSLDRLTVGVQGLGHVGYELCRLLYRAGARLIVCDVDSGRVERAIAEFGAKAMEPSRFIRSKMDVFAPCALGGVLSSDSVLQLKASVVCGAANNQLAAPDVDDMMSSLGVLYAPDYLVNAGGIINVSAEYLGESTNLVDSRVRAIPERLANLLHEAKRTDTPTGKAADAMAQAIAQRARRERGGDLDAVTVATAAA